MRGGVILIALALLIGYLGVTGRYKCFSVFLACLYNPVGYGFVGVGEGGASDPMAQPGARGPIIVQPGSSGVNESGGQIYDARNYLPPIDAFI
jgi:hypothetical protein